MSYEKLMGMMPEIRKAAEVVAYKWPNVVEAEDVAQDIFLRLMATANSVDKLEAMEEGRRKGSLIMIGHQLAAAERNDRDVFSGRFNYSVDEVRKHLLKRALDPQSGRFDVAAFDVQEAFEELKEKNPNYASAIYQRFVLEVQPDKNALNRGVEKLTLLMNRESRDKETEFLRGGRCRVSTRNRWAVREAQEGYDGVDTDD